MRYVPKILLVSIFVLLASFSTTFSQHADLQAVEKNIAQRIQSGPLVGIAIGYISPEGEVSYLTMGSHSIGSDKPVNKQSVFKIGSVTKVFTSLAAAGLLDEKNLSLDTKAQDLLPPDFDLPAYDGKEITLKHLVAHISGLPRLPGNLTINDLQNPYADYSAQKMKSFLSEHDLQRAPGSKFEYSNLGMAVVGQILEEQYSMEYDQVIRTQIAEPLNMKNTGIQLEGADSSRFTRGHYSGQPVPYWDFPGVEGMGALQSTVSDMVAFLKAVMNAETSASPIAGAVQKTQQLLFDISDEKSKQLDSVGMGWLMSTKQDSIWWHNGGTGGYHSFIGYNIEQETGVIMLSNARSSVDDIGFHLLDSRHALKTN